MYSGEVDGLYDDYDDEIAAGLGLGGGSNAYTPGGNSSSTTSTTHPQQQQQQFDQDAALSPSDGLFGRASQADDPSDPYGHTSLVPFATNSPDTVPTSSQVPRVPNVWVSDPSLEPGTTAEQKEQEARRERESAVDHLNSGNNPSSFLSSPPNQIRPSTTSHQPFSPPLQRLQHHHPRSLGPGSSSFASPSRSRRSDTLYSERSSLFSEAPPAYTPSPTSPSTTNNYQTFSSSSSGRPTPPSTVMGRPSESEGHGLLAGQTYQAIPQSMGGEPDEEGHYVYPRPPRSWRDRVKSFDWRRNWKLILLGVLLAFVTIGFLVSSVKSVKDERTIKFPGDKLPNTQPGIKIPLKDEDGVRLAYPAYDGDMPWGASCAPTQIKYQNTKFNLDFLADRNVSLFQDINESDPGYGTDVRVAGTVILRRSPADSPDASSILLETVSNSPAIVLGLEWEWDGVGRNHRLAIGTPRAIPNWSSRQQGGQPCVQIRATVWVPADAAIDSLNIETVHLGLALLDNLSLRASRFARLASTVGGVVVATDGEKDAAQLMRDAPPPSFVLDSRYVEVKTLSSSITGSYPLYDYLGLQTVSGTIKARVQPHEALQDMPPRPAVLFAKSTSGNIELYEPVPEEEEAAEAISSSSSSTPSRQYGVDLYSKSGNVKLHAAFGPWCKAHTTSGNVDLTLVPMLARGAQQQGPYLETQTTSGTTTVNVREVLWRDDLDSLSWVVGSPEPAPAPAPVPALPVRDADPYDLLTSPENNNNKRDDDDDDDDAAAAVSKPDTPALSNLNARHQATSATISVHYPASYEGYIDADTLSGKLAVGGQGLRVIREDSQFPGIGKHILAHKGPESTGGTVKLHTTSGRITAVVG